MFRTTSFFGLVVTVLTISGTAIAADKYGSPTIPAGEKAVTTYDVNPYAKETVDFKGTTWTVTGSGGYNYDDQWAFSKLEVKLTYLSNKEGVASKPGPSMTWTGEGAFGVPGTWSVNFTNLAPPGTDYKLMMEPR